MVTREKGFCEYGKEMFGFMEFEVLFLLAE